MRKKTIKLTNILENTIATVSQKINVKIEIDKSNHATERQFRDANFISDENIIKVVTLALPEIANKLIFDEIGMGSYILVKQVFTDINVVGALHPGVNGEIDFVVIT